MFLHQRFLRLTPSLLLGLNLPLTILLDSQTAQAQMFAELRTRGDRSPVQTIEKQAIALEQNAASSNLAAAQTGIEFANSSRLNAGTITDLLITRISESGDRCSDFGYVPGFTHSSTEVQSGSLVAWFVSSSTPPAPGLRVVIWNSTLEQAATQTPYTDREYDQGLRSEDFRVRFGTLHSEQYLAVAGGENHFTYEIRRGDQVIESDSFTAFLDQQTESTTERSTASDRSSFADCLERQQLEEIRRQNAEIRRQNEALQQQLEEIRRRQPAEQIRRPRRGDRRRH